MVVGGGVILDCIILRAVSNFNGASCIYIALRKYNSCSAALLECTKCSGVLNKVDSQWNSRKLEAAVNLQQRRLRYLLKYPEPWVPYYESFLWCCWRWRNSCRVLHTVSISYTLASVPVWTLQIACRYEWSCVSPVSVGPVMDCSLPLVQWQPRSASALLRPRGWGKRLG